MKNAIVYVGLALLLALGLGSCTRLTSQSVQQINDLHDCALLVRLPHQDDKVDKLNQAGRVKQAEAVQNHTRDFNLSVMADFKKNFDFSPVFFFYSEDTDKVRQNLLDGIFLGSDLLKDPDLKLDCSDYLIMDYGEVDQEATSWMSVKWIVKDKNFRPLNNPFPYHILWGSSGQEIERFNNKFAEYHLSAQDYIATPEEVEVEIEE